MVHIRDFRPDDANALVAVHRSAIMASPDAFYNQAQRESWAHGLAADQYIRANADGETFIVATDHDLPIGFCSWNRRSVVGLYVAPGHQGRGCGRALLGRAEDALRALGVGTSTIHSSLQAVPFYQAHGYVITGETNHPSRGGLAMRGTLLEKALTP